MSNTEIIKLVARFLGYTLLQGVFLENASISNYALCFPYISFIILLPFSVLNMTSLLMAFGLGISVDIFYDTLGMHAAASVFTAFFRIHLLKWMSSGDDLDKNLNPYINSMGFQWFFIYSSALIAVHHITLFIIEASNWKLIIPSIFQALASSLFTLAIVIGIQYLFFPARRKSF